MSAPSNPDGLTALTCAGCNKPIGFIKEPTSIESYCPFCVEADSMLNNVRGLLGVELDLDTKDISLLLSQIKEESAKGSTNINWQALTKLLQAITQADNSNDNGNTKTNITSKKKLALEKRKAEIIQIASTYDSYKEFREHEGKLYSFTVNHGIAKEVKEIAFAKHRARTLLQKKKQVFIKAYLYETYKEFQDNCRSGYLAAIKNNWQQELKDKIFYPQK